MGTHRSPETCRAPDMADWPYVRRMNDIHDVIEVPHRELTNAIDTHCRLHELMASMIRTTVRSIVALARRLGGGTTRSSGPAVDSRAGELGLPVLDDLESVVALVRQRPSLFLRYSEGPAADIGTVSRDYEADVDLPGLSVTTIAPESWWPLPTEDWIARRLCKYDELGQESGRFPWLLSGRRVATGPDHEPIIELHEPVAVVGDGAMRQARQRYRRRFQIGENSTNDR